MSAVTRAASVVRVAGLAIAALSAGCPRDEPAPCVAATCAADCTAVGLSGGACAGGACQCSPPIDPDADADADLDADPDLDDDVDGLVVLPECAGGGPRCANDWFLCADRAAPDADPAGSFRRCEGQIPALGGEPSWACVVQSDTMIACTGDSLPEHVVGFVCSEPDPGDARCNRHLYTPAERPAADWDCHYERAVYLVCESTGAAVPPEGCCVPGAARICDTPQYCNWGTQTCNDDGLSWGSCDETSAAAECAGEAWYSPAAEACCIASRCCQDMWDLDGDGDVWESLGDCDGITCGG